jgi:hypothetical protein
MAGVVIQAFLLLLLFGTGTILPEDDVITDGIHFIIVLFMPAIFFLVIKGYDGPDNLALAVCSSIDVLIYTVMILGFLWWRQKQREASEAETRALKII